MVVARCGPNETVQSEIYHSKRLSGSLRYLDLSQISVFHKLTKNNQNFPSLFSAMPVDLPTSEVSVPEGATFVVSGWGTTSEGGSLPSTLRQVEVPYVNDDDCSDSYGSSSIFGDVMICAGEGGKDSCQGDSGGPMTYDGTHIGIVSWGYGCARNGYPGVYSQTDAFLSWIAGETMKNM